jgi:hypothetical protein
MGATTEITYYVAPDSFDSADKQYNDIPASLEAYADELEEGLAYAFPGAKVDVQVAHGRSFAFQGDDDVLDMVQDIARDIFDRGEFWQAPQA